MTAKDFFDNLVNHDVNAINILLEILTGNKIKYCIIGGLAVNAYVEPVVSLDLDIVVAAEKQERLIEKLKTYGFLIRNYKHSINASVKGANLSIQIQIDKRYQKFIQTAAEKEILGYKLHVASLENVLQGKIWACGDKQRRLSKRKKDIADIVRILEQYPHLINMLPETIKAMIK